MKEYYDDGKLLFEGEYKCYKRYNGRIYDKNGKIIDEIKEFKSLKEKEDENKKIKFEGEYLEGKYWKGKYKEYYDIDNHILKFEGEYINGELNGIGKEYNEGGKLIYEGEYLNGKTIGQGKEYYDNGILKYEGEFISLCRKQGKGKLYNIKDELIFEGEFYENKKWNGYGKEYFNEDDENNENNLILKYEGEYHNGKKIGKGKEYNEKGQIISEGIFENGEFV